MHGSLQNRIQVLDVDFERANDLPEDYETDLELEWSNPSRSATLIFPERLSLSCLLDLFADGNDFSWETIAHGRNRFYQKRLAKSIDQQTAKITSLLTQAMIIHLNRVQQWQLNTSSVFISIESLPVGSLSNKDIEPIRDVRMRLPSTLILNTTETESLFIRVCSWSLLSQTNFFLSRQRSILWLLPMPVN